jgi:uncharacterized RDD family membrane protein YckC
MLMSTENIRAILALLIVGVFMIITAFMALYPLLTPQQVQLNDYADFFAKTSSVYTGIIGVIVGYYFGRPTRMQGQTTDAAAQVPEKE